MAGTDLDWLGFEDDGSPPKLITSFSDIRTRKTVEVGFVKEYLPHWTCKEAFREVYQNWRDGILRSSNLPLPRFSPEYSERAGLILIQKLHPDTKELLGYIRFKYKKDGYGQMEATNLRASLQYRHLKIGATSKAHDDGQTGKHGEGFKIAALIFRRHPNNHTFRIESAGVSCNFIFNSELDLACTITRMSASKLAGVKENAGRPVDSLIANPSKDVSIYIGELRKSTTSEGGETRGKKIHIEDFKEWLKVTLDIDPPASIVQTPFGSLILDPSYKNMFYLQGLLLPSGSMSGKAHRYGYNFFNGRTTRERDSLSSPGQEARHITRIWAAAILDGGEKSSELLAIYTDLLIKSLNNVGDVMLTSYKQWLSKDIMEKVWSHMRTINQASDGQTAFYYTPTDGKDDVHIIKHSLKQHPVALTADFWDILRWFELPRTPHEELQDRFSHAAIIKAPDEMFAQNMQWMLQCCIQSHEATKSMDFEFVDGKDLAIDSAYFDPVWRFHSKWLTFDGTHQNTFCDQQCPNERDPFCCDHAVLFLWGHMISQLVATDSSSLSDQDEILLKSMTQTRISQMPRGVKCARNEKGGQLVVTWESADSYQNKNKPIRVVLHTENCTNELQSSWKHPLNTMFNPKEGEQGCDCPSKLSEVASSGVTFTDLDPLKRYFPSVSRDVEGAFIGRHPFPLRPLHEDFFIKQELVASSIADNIMGSTDDSQDAEEITHHQSATVNSINDEGDDDNDHESLYGDPMPDIPSSPPIGQPLGDENLVNQGNSAPSNVAVSGRKTTPEAEIITSANVDNLSASSIEAYVIGDRVDHGTLDWGGSFPGSHSFYRTRDRPDEDVYIVKPKTHVFNKNGKRLQDEATEHLRVKKTRTDLVMHGSALRSKNLEGNAQVASPPSLSRTYLRRQTSPTITPAPPGDISYRY